MPIYTKTGDDGQTHQIDGQAVSKADPRMVAGGAIDELNAAIGSCIAEANQTGPETIAEALQNGGEKEGVQWLTRTAASKSGKVVA